MTIIRTPYQPTERVVKTFSEPSRTKQAHRAECDMNTILAKYRKTGLLTHVASYGGTYLDLPEEADYQSCVHFVMRAQRAFEQLPAHARKRFNNDPGNFLAFAENPANRDEMVKMGLMLPPPAPQPSPEGSPSVDSAETPPAGSAGS